MLRDVHDGLTRCLRAAGASAVACGVVLHRVRERLREQQQRRADEQRRARSRRRGSRRASPSATGGRARRAEERCVHGGDPIRHVAPTPSLLRADPRPGAGEAVVERDLRPPAELALGQATRRAPSGGRRRAAPARSRGAGAAAGDRGARACSSSTVVSRPVPTLNGPPPRARRPRAARRRRRRRRRSRASARRRRRSSSRSPRASRSRKIATTPPSRPGVLPRPVDVREAQRRRGCVPWMRFQPARYSSPQSFAIPYGESGRSGVCSRSRARRTRRRSRRRSRRRRPARPRRGARARSPCRRRSPRRRSSGRCIDVCTSACAARWKTTSASTENGSRMSCSSSVAAGFTVLALAGGEVVDDRHLVAARDERVDEVRADEAGASGDDRPHRGRIVGADVRHLRRTRRVREDDAGGAARRVAARAGADGARDARAGRHAARRGDPRASSCTGSR